MKDLGSKVGRIGDTMVFCASSDLLDVLEERAVMLEEFGGLRATAESCLKGGCNALLAVFTKEWQQAEREDLHRAFRKYMEYGGPHAFVFRFVRESEGLSFVALAREALDGARKTGVIAMLLPDREQMLEALGDTNHTLGFAVADTHEEYRQKLTELFDYVSTEITPKTKLVKARGWEAPN